MLSLNTRLPRNKLSFEIRTEKRHLRVPFLCFIFST